MTPPPNTLEIPDVCFEADLARILRTSRRTIQRLRRQGAFPIPELPSIDAKARWSGAQVRRFIETGQTLMRSTRRYA